MNYYNKCSKWRPFVWTQAEKTSLSSIASLTTVCCTPDHTTLSCSFKLKKKSFTVVFYPFVANYLTNLLPQNLFTHTDFKIKYIC